MSETLANMADDPERALTPSSTLGIKGEKRPIAVILRLKLWFVPVSPVCRIAPVISVLYQCGGTVGATVKRRLGREFRR